MRWAWAWRGISLIFCIGSFGVATNMMKEGRWLESLPVCCLMAFFALVVTWRPSE